MKKILHCFVVERKLQTTKNVKIYKKVKYVFALNLQTISKNTSTNIEKTTIMMFLFMTGQHYISLTFFKDNFMI